MKYIWLTNSEENSLKELAHRAKMDWFNSALTTCHSIAQSDLSDLCCGFQFENISLMTNVDMITCYDLFVKAGVMDSIGHNELFKLFNDRKVYKDGQLTDC